MIRCLAIDDEPLALEQLKNFISKIPYLELVAACPSAMDAKDVLSHEMIDAIFCDINMPDLNGMDFIKSLASPPLIVFTTAYSEYALEGYKVDAVDYLLKPFGLDEFRRAAEKLLKRIGETGISPVSEKSEIEEITTKEPTQKIEASTDCTDERGLPQKPVIALYSLKRIEERLPEVFMRIHRSYIINLRYVKEVSKTRVTMENNVILPIGELYKENLNNYLLRNYIGK